MALDPRIEAVRAKYDLDKDDFWQIKQNKQWVCRHAALEIVAVKAGVEWMPPMIIEANAPALVTSMVVTGKMGDRVEWATGETNPTNYSVSGKQPAYPWAMSEKRAKDRVVLKLVGIHGLVYSEIEADSFDEPRTTDQRSEQGRREVARQQQEDAQKPSSADMKRKLVEIDQDLIDCHTIADVNKCAKIWAALMDRDNWPSDFRDCAVPKFGKRREEIQEKEAA